MLGQPTKDSARIARLFAHNHSKRPLAGILTKQRPNALETCVSVSAVAMYILCSKPIRVIASVLARIKFELPIENNVRNMSENQPDCQHYP